MASHDPVPPPSDPAHLSRDYGSGSQAHLPAGQTETADFAHAGHAGNPPDSSPLSQTSQQQTVTSATNDIDISRSSSPTPNREGVVSRSASRASTLNASGGPSRSGTLKKKSSVRRSGSKKSIGRSGSVRTAPPHDEATEEDYNNVFHTPIPTTGTPTEILAERFQAWRKLLKELITYFREIQNSYEQRSKALLKVSNVINNMNAPTMFLSDGGLYDAVLILTEYSKQAVFESNKARDIENDVVTQLSGLRSDLNQKIKEIKGLSGDFKNSVDKEKEATKRAVLALRDALDVADTDPRAGSNQPDPYIIRLGVDRQVERQLDEENYLHRAYLNLESSGRELESIVVGEIQKAYNAYAGILKREADAAYGAVEGLRGGPIAIPKDLEWNTFVEHDPHFVNPRSPLRRVEDIEYPGRHHPAAAEIRAGMLERKSKYLKSYTPGWYVLSPTHLHEFKSADRIYTQPPVMSLYLPDQKLGSLSQPNSSSHKFMLKGRQTGSMHRGHSWVFRAESHETMLAWYSDIKSLTEKSGEERIAFVRKHARSVSTGSQKAASVGSSEGAMEEDEADEVPYTAVPLVNEPAKETPPQRPQPGGRFPSDIQVNRRLQAPLSPSSGSSDNDRDLSVAAEPVAVSGVSHNTAREVSPTRQGEEHFANGRHDARQPLAPRQRSPARAADTSHAGVLQEPTQAHRPVDYYEDTAPMATAPAVQPVAAAAHTPQHQPTSRTEQPGEGSESLSTTQPHPGGPQSALSSSDTAKPDKRRENDIGNAASSTVKKQPGGPHPAQRSTQPAPSGYGAYEAPRQDYAHTQTDHQSQPVAPSSGVRQDSSSYGQWLAPAAGGAAVGVLGTEAYRSHQQTEEDLQSSQANDHRYDQQPWRPSQSSEATHHLPNQQTEDPSQLSPATDHRQDQRLGGPSQSSEPTDYLPIQQRNELPQPLQETSRLGNAPNLATLSATNYSYGDQARGGNDLAYESPQPGESSATGYSYGDQTHGESHRQRDSLKPTTPSATSYPHGDQTHEQRDHSGDSHKPTAPSATGYSYGDFRGVVLHDPPVASEARELPTEPEQSRGDSSAPLSAVTYSFTGAPNFSGIGTLSQEAPVIETLPHVPQEVRPTGHIFPSVLRHNPDLSVKDLHVPGEFPATPRP